MAVLSPYSMCIPFAFLSGAPGPMEIILIFVVILILFGPKRLPEVARMIGRTLDELRKASQDFKDQIMAIDEEPDGSDPVDDTREPGMEEDGSGEFFDDWTEGEEHYGDVI